MSDVGKMIHSCSDKQERSFQQRDHFRNIPFLPMGVGLSSEEVVPCPAANAADISGKFFMMVINTQISVLNYRCTKHDKWCEQHKPPLQRLSKKATCAGGRLHGFQNFPSSKSRYQTVLMASCTPLLLIPSLDQLGYHNVKKWHKQEPRSPPPAVHRAGSL